LRCGLPGEAEIGRRMRVYPTSSMACSTLPGRVDLGALRLLRRDGVVQLGLADRRSAASGRKRATSCPLSTARLGRGRDPPSPGRAWRGRAGRRCEEQLSFLHLRAFAVVQRLEVALDPGAGSPRPPAARMVAVSSRDGDVALDHLEDRDLRCLCWRRGRFLPASGIGVCKTAVQAREKGPRRQHKHRRSRSSRWSSGRPIGGELTATHARAGGRGDPRPGRGYLKSLDYREGGGEERTAALTIDDQPYRAKLAQVKGDLAAPKPRCRKRTWTWRASVRSPRSARSARPSWKRRLGAEGGARPGRRGQGHVEQAMLDVGYTRIAAPISACRASAAQSGRPGGQGRSERS